MDSKSKTNIKQLALSDNFDGSTDPVRNDTEFYEEATIGRRIGTKRAKDPTKQFFTNSNSFRNYEFLNEKIQKQDEYPYISFSEEIKIKVNPFFGDPSIDIDKIFTDFYQNSILPNVDVDFEDYKFSIKAPIEYASKVGNKSTVQGDVNFMYNYGSEKYESIVDKNNVTESEIDNFYDFYQVVSDSREDFIKKFYNKRNIVKLLISGSVHPEKVRTGEYQNYILPKDTYINSTSLQQYIKSFPALGVISFENPPGTKENETIKDAIFDNSLATSFCDLMNILLANEPLTALFVEKEFVISNLKSSYSNEQQTEFDEQYEIESQKLKLYDMGLLLEQGFVKRLEEQENFQNRFLQNYNTGFYEPYSLARSSESKYALSKNWSDTIEIDFQRAVFSLNSSLTNIVRDKARKYKDILSGEKNYTSNVLFYRIAKFEFGSKTPIQNFWVPAEKSYLGLDYIDSQVKYGKKYTYKVYAYKVIIGSEYSYSEVPFVTSTSLSFRSALTDMDSLVKDDVEILNGLALSVSDLEDEFNEQLGTTGKEVGPRWNAVANYFLTKEFKINDLLKSIDEYLFNIGDSRNNREIVNFVRSIIAGNPEPFGPTDTLFSDSSFSEAEFNLLLEISSKWGAYELVYEDLIYFNDLSKQYRRVLETLFPLTDSSYDFRDNPDHLNEFTTAINNMGLEITPELVVELQTRYKDAVTQQGKGPAKRGKFTEALRAAGLLDFYLRKARGLDESAVIVLPTNYKVSKNEIIKFGIAFQSDTTAGLESLVKVQSAYNDLIKTIRLFDADVELEDPGIKLNFTTKPAIKLAEIPYFEDSGAILDNPPNFPNSSFITYKDVMDRVSVLLNSGQGSLEQDPVTFSESEENYFSLYRESRKLNDFQKILFKTDEFENIPVNFEVRRLPNPPLSYKDFREATVSYASTSYNGDKKASSAVFADNVQPNRKYYYMFRAIDRRGIFSNPTPIFEVEIVENSGAVYPLIKSYELKNSFKSTTKNLKRLINIVPRLKQVLPSPGSLRLGTEDNPLFGNKFKLRLTSKKTGKVVDLNIDFTRRNV